jgi:phospholipid/cholesterol/gamma-HCH transport system substrate-binding protein
MTSVGRGAVAVTLLLVAALAVILVVRGSGSNYEVKAHFVNASQLVKGAPVQTGGIPIGSVTDIGVSRDGQAIVTMKIDKDGPLRQGTRAIVKQLSLSGQANRYIDLTFPSSRAPKIPDGGIIAQADTSAAVDLDELFDTLDTPTRRSLQDFIKGNAEQFVGVEKQANEGLRYLPAALSTSSRLFRQVSRDTPALQHFLVDSARLVTDLAERRDALAALIGNLNTTTRALGDQRVALAEAIDRLPPFMRRANSTFVDLRAALDDVDPLVTASKPVAAELGPFLSEARRFSSAAVPTIRDLRTAVRKPGAGNDLIDLMHAIPPLNDIATATKTRTYAPGGRAFSVGRVSGAFTQMIRAMTGATPVLAFARPYTTDFLGWFDDFSTTGANIDALGANARAHISLAELLTGGPVKKNQFRRCPGSAEAAAADGSNVFSASEQAALHCSEADRATGP